MLVLLQTATKWYPIESYLLFCCLFCCLFRQLQDTNAALRAKEAMQFDMLRGYEDSMQKMTFLLCEMAGREGADAAESVAALSAIMVALRSEAQELVQQLRGHASSTPTHSTLSFPDLNSNSSAQPESSPPNSAGLPEALFPMGSFTGRHTRLMWATVTPETVLELRGITGRQLAGVSTCNISACMMQCICFT